MNVTTRTMAAMTAVVALAVCAVIPAFATSVEQKDTIIFLLDGACDNYELYASQFPEAYVTCSEESLWQGAHVHYSGFEQYYKVVYVVNSHTVSAHNEGKAWWDGAGHGYAFAQEFIEVVRHELQHLQCQCLNTPDGVHRFGDN